MNKLTGPVRNISPCKGYDKWRADVAETNRKRVEYAKQPKPVFVDLSKKGKRW